jgi:mono/diheme cytochrome c family protein
MMYRRITILSALCVAALAENSLAADTTPVASWDFGAEKETQLTPHGSVLRDQAGPRPPEFPDFSKSNTAVRLDGKSAYFSVADPGPESDFDFTNGDAITLEAWVKVDGIRNGQPMYVIGKGRTNSPKFARDNQNWSFRVVGTRDMASLGFLFAGKPGPGDAHWHRWTSKAGFDTKMGWHHVAIAYRFGDPKTIRGWIDGQPTDGTWDLGGPTKEAPIVDDDAVWIGSSLGGNPGNSFNGLLDAVAIHRTLLDDKTMAARFNRVGGPRVVGPLPEVMPELGDLPAGRTLVTIAEGLPAYERWLNEGEIWPEETTRWLGDSFLLPRIPIRYDDWGIRADWKAPMLVRLSADVTLPAGKHRFLLRARALSRLWVDGKVIARTEAITKQPPNGEEPVTPVAKPPVPGVRLPGYHQQEVFGEATIAKPDKRSMGETRVVLEMIIGGKNLRAETGEICVAILSEDGKSYLTLRPTGSPEVPLTEAAIEPELARIEASLAKHDNETRRSASASQDEFWKRRHATAKAWARKHPAPPVPTARNKTAKHPVDAFISSRIERALDAASGSDAGQADKFHNQILPILREHCFRCHGEKSRGGLKLNARELVLQGGDSEIPAVIPGKPGASELIVRIRSKDEDLRMPPTGDELSKEQVATLEKWVQSGAAWPAPPIDPTEVALSPRVKDEAFLRRVYLDTVGVPPTANEIELFLADNSANKRNRMIDRLLFDARGADHRISHWLDALAENPTLLNGSLNSTGPFRFFLHDSLRDNKSLDRMVTELILMRGSKHGGGSAGFSMAAENDAPFAAKGHILASTFLGVELQCARCHDSPYHSTTQRDLYSLAAMLQRKPATVPKTSRVPAAFFENQSRESLIRVTLKPDESVAAAWPFANVTGVADDTSIDGLTRQPKDSRERLAALITAPQNQRFPRVIVNRIWKRLIGAGFVEPTHDWEGRKASHPELLDWLARELITHDYDVTHVLRLVLTSRTYQRTASGNNLRASHEERFFNAPERRRLTAEQIVDSMHAVTGVPMDIGELTFVHDGRRPLSNRLTLGRPNRSWMLASLNNERDRPSLSLPQARAETDVLQAFGWTGSRQKPITDRDPDPNILQPGILANGILTSTLTRASHNSGLAELAVHANSPESLADALFLRILSRRPEPAERATFTSALAEGFDSRLVPSDQIEPPKAPPPPLPLITWFNHQRQKATKVQNEVERRVRKGPPADPRLQPQWREVYEDLIWSLVNQREFVWMP